MRAFVIAMENEAAEVRPFLKDDDRLYVAGVGKVNAAAAAQKAIDAGADEIINCGVAGGLDPAMEVGEAYEISQAVEYDFDLTLINGTKLGTHNERTTPYFDCRTTGFFVFDHESIHGCGFTAEFNGCFFNGCIVLFGNV